MRLKMGSYDLGERTPHLDAERRDPPLARQSVHEALEELALWLRLTIYPAQEELTVHACWERSQDPCVVLLMDKEP